MSPAAAQTLLRVDSVAQLQMNSYNRQIQAGYRTNEMLEVVEIQLHKRNIQVILWLVKDVQICKVCEWYKIDMVVAVVVQDGGMCKKFLYILSLYYCLL